jgi:UTP--glucose-1-phosphate uridylyltransferase
MTDRIKIGVILLAGKGERLGDKTIGHPKPLLDIGKETIGHKIVLSFLDAGIKTIIMVCSPEQLELVKVRFSPDLETQRAYRSGKRSKYLGDVVRVWEEAEIEYVVQDPDKDGKGDGIALAAAFIKIFRQPFVLSYGDGLFETPSGNNVIQQVMRAYEKHGDPVVVLDEVSEGQVSSFGIARLEDVENQLPLIKGFVEKPKPQEAPSRLAAVGVYAVTPVVMKYLPVAPTGADGELRLADLLAMLLDRKGNVRGITLDGSWYDTGDMQSLEVARTHFNLQDLDLGPAIEKYLLSHGWQKQL